MLLGDPEIPRGHGVLDYGSGTLRWHGELLPLEMGPDDPRHKIGHTIGTDCVSVLIIER